MREIKYLQELREEKVLNIYSIYTIIFDETKIATFLYRDVISMSARLLICHFWSVAFKSARSVD